MSDIKRQLQQNNEELAEMIESVNDMSLHLQNLKVTENGTYTAGAGYDAIGQVEVEVAGGGAGSIETCTLYFTDYSNGYSIPYSYNGPQLQNGNFVYGWHDTGIELVDIKYKFTNMPTAGMLVVFVRNCSGGMVSYWSGEGEQYIGDPTGILNFGDEKAFVIEWTGLSPNTEYEVGYFY